MIPSPAVVQPFFAGDWHDRATEAALLDRFTEQRMCTKVYNCVRGT